MKGVIKRARMDFGRFDYSFAGAGAGRWQASKNAAALGGRIELRRHP
jgi:hypothetical protein